MPAGIPTTRINKAVRRIRFLRDMV